MSLLLTVCHDFRYFKLYTRFPYLPTSWASLRRFKFPSKTRPPFFETCQRLGQASGGSNFLKKTTPIFKTLPMSWASLRRFKFPPNKRPLASALPQVGGIRVRPGIRQVRGVRVGCAPSEVRGVRVGLPPPWVRGVAALHASVIINISGPWISIN